MEGYISREQIVERIANFVTPSLREGKRKHLKYPKLNTESKHHDTFHKNKN